MELAEFCTKFLKELDQAIDMSEYEIIRGAPTKMEEYTGLVGKIGGYKDARLIMKEIVDEATRKEDEDEQ